MPLGKASDIAVGGGAMTTPLWLAYLGDVAQILTIFLGLILVSVRLALALREWRHNHPARKESP